MAKRPVGQCLLGLCQLAGIALAGSPAVAAISGRAFLDIDGDGAFTVGPLASDSPVAGVRITAWPAAGAPWSTTTDASGRYLLAVPASTRVRLEFAGLPAGMAPAGLAVTSPLVAALTTPASGDLTRDLALLSPVEHCQREPQIAVAFYTPGPAGAANQDRPVVVRFPYSASGAQGSGYVPAESIALHREVGSVFGLAYHGRLDRLFAAAHLRRGDGFGPGGPGAIYRIDRPASSTPEVALWADLNALFPGAAGSDPHVFTVPPYDDIESFLYDRGDTAEPAAIPPNLVGKSSLGGIKLSLDRQILYVMSLGDRRLYRLPAEVAPTAANVTAVPVPQPADCAPSDFLPFAVGVRGDGDVFVGAVCSDESHASPGGVRAYVFHWAGGGFDPTPVLAFSLQAPALEDPLAGSYAARETLTGDAANPSGSPTSPLLTDLFFDGEDLVLAVRDSWGDRQYGSVSIEPTGGFFRACPTAAPERWELERNGRCGGTTGGRADYGHGFLDPATGGRGYFYDQSNAAADTVRAGFGAGGRIPGGEIFSVGSDPLGDFFQAAGVIYFTPQGRQSRAYMVYHNVPGSPTTFGKVGGLGSAAPLCQDAPLEVGDTVWRDLDGDGLQDAGEPPLPGVTVDLADPAGATLASAVTDAAGRFLFSSATADAAGRPLASTESFRFAVAGLVPATAGYTLRIRLVAGSNGTLLSGLIAAPRHAASPGSAAEQGERDSDAVALSGGFEIAFATGLPGGTLDGLDFGFAPAAPLPAGDVPTLSGWGMALLAAGLAAAGARLCRRLRPG